MRSWPRELQAVLFDLDGVLANSFEAWVGVLDECRERRGLAPLGVAGVTPYWGQGIEADCETLFPGATPESLVAEYDEAFPKYVDRIQPIDGGAALVQTLERRGIPIWVVTNCPRALARAILEAIGLSQLVDRVTGGDDVARGKPDPEIIQRGLANTGATADGAILVGDTTNDVAAGARAEVFVVGLGVDADWRVEHLAQLEERLR
ncbi:MAG: HAD family hydrolase [Planctomycetota bacterium]